MSSMLKKKGGLSFKPKPKAVPRRPGGAASSSQAPTTENSSQASTPAPTIPPTATHSPESPNHDAGATAKETPNEPPKETPRAVVAEPLTQAQPVPTVQPTTEPATGSISSSIAINKSPRQEPSAPTPASTRSITRPTLHQQTTPTPIPPPARRTAQPTPAPESSTSGSPPATIIPHPPTAANLQTPEPSIQEQDGVAPPTAPPSPALVSDTIDVSAPVNGPPATAPKRKKAPRKRTSATDGNTDAEGPAPKKRRAPRKKTTTESNGTTPAEGEEGAQPVNKASKRRRRSPTPEDPETMTVDHGTMKMAELTQDLGIGKRFKHADAIAERAREARERFRLKKIEKQKRLMGLLPPEEDSASRAGTPAEGEENGRDSALARARELGASASADAQHTVGYDVIDGQIIINQQSLVVDRHAAHRDMSTLETVEEDEFSHVTTCVSFRRESRKTGPNHWTEEETEKFYRLLGMFGTDFETIASMFPEKSRRAVKLKFNREENLRPKRIDATVMVRGEKKVGIDLEEYKSHQREWQESDKIMAEHAKLVQEHEEDIRRLKEERRAAGLLDEDEDEQQQQANDQDGKDDQNAQGDGPAGQGGDTQDGQEHQSEEHLPANTEVAISA
ncbi:UV excision repair protein rad23 [Hypoxylon texense]